MSIYPIDLLSFILALLIGLIVGLERSFRANIERSIKEAGIRTFTLASVFGFFSAFIFKGSGYELLVILTLFSFIFLFTALLRSFEDKPGMTTSLALLLVFLTGVLLGLEYPLEGIIVGLGTWGLLWTKRILHHFADLLSDEELSSGIRFLTVGAILLPIAYTIGPIHPLIGPGRIFDPMQALMMVLFVSSISFTSYLVIKFFGADRGMKISAFTGGLVSSAAATASISEKCKTTPELERTSTVGILLTNSSMFMKDYIIIFTAGGVVLAGNFAFPLGALLGLTVLLFFYIRKYGMKNKAIESIDLELDSPFALKPAVKFALLFSLIWSSTYLLQNQFGGLSVYIVSIGGLVSTTSVSAYIASMYASGQISSPTAVSTILLAFGFSSISKILIARAYFEDLSKKIALPMILTSALSVGMVVFLT